MGSGTTAIAARKLGRHFVGCDLSQEYVAMANLRLQHTSKSELAAALKGEASTLPMFGDI